MKTVNIWIRSLDASDKETYRKYQVPVDGETSVLNALEYVHQNLDPTVAYRSSCRRGVCATCLTVINGRKQLACETLVKDGMKIDPFTEGE